MDGVLLIQVIIVLLVIGVIFYLLRLYHGIQLEKRIAPFAIDSVNTYEPSLFDSLSKLFWIIIKKISKLISKSSFISKYAERYNKYIVYEERQIKDGIDYISIKFFLSFLVIVLACFSLAFQTFKLDFMFVLIIFIVSFFIPDIYLNLEFAKKRKYIEEDLLKAIIIMNNAFNSGKNIMQAAGIVKDTLDGPIQDEFKKIYLDITYGLELDVVFNRFYERVKLEDAKYITTSLALLNKTGGDIVKVFSLIEKSIFQKKNLKNELHSLTASSRFVFKMLAILPFVFVIMIFMLNPSYFKPLITSSVGIVILIVTLILYILYILIIRKVLEVKIWKRQ